mmetsp:Transcript_62995/g.153404  ORF Transcript_62995/g.153404 Transcript_62995/m.153404 type:complete len:708 (-) Transcript_62995:153-2276(-)
MDNMNMNNCPSAITDDSKASSSSRRDDDDDGGVITTTNRNDINNPEEDITDTDSIAATTTSVATGTAVAAASIASTGGYSGDCSSSEESCPTSSRSPDKIGLVIDITQKLCDGTSNSNINRKRKHHSKDKESSTSSNGSAANRRGKHDDRKRRRRTHDISRRYGNTDGSGGSGNGSSNMRMKRMMMRRSLNHKGHIYDFHSHLSTANACNDILLQPSLLHSEPSPIHPDIDPSITKLVKSWHGGTPTATGYDAAAAATAAFGTDQLSSHYEWQTMKKGKELLQKQQQCVSDSLCAISDVLQTYLEAVENNPSSSSEMATATGTNTVIGAGNSSDDGSASRKTTSTGAISTDHRRHNRHNDYSETKRNKHKQLPNVTTSTTTRPDALPPSSTDSWTNKYYVEPSSQHLGDTFKGGHQNYRHPNLISNVVTYSDQSVSLEKSLDLTNSPRLLLEASPPHRVIHANAAFSKLIILEDQKAKKKNNDKKKRSIKEKSNRTDVATTSTATCDWIQKQNTPPPSFGAASTAVTSSSSSSSATSLLAAAAAAAWKNRSLQDAIEQMIPERVSVSGTTGGPHGIQQNHRYVFTCYPVRVPSFSGTYTEPDSSSSSDPSSSSSSKKATSSSSAVAAAAGTVTGSDDAFQSNIDRKVHHVRGDNGIGINGRQSHVSHYLIEGSVYDASASSFDTKSFSSKSACAASSKLTSHSRAVG